MKSQSRRRDVGGSSLTVLPFADEDYRSVRVRETRYEKLGGGQVASVMSEVKSVQRNETTWKDATSWAPMDSTEFALDTDSAAFYNALDEDVMNPDASPPDEDQAPKKKTNSKPRSQISKRPHVVWKHHYRSVYLDELARHSGRGDFGGKDEVCQDCCSRKATEPGSKIYRCVSDCFLNDLVCQDCCVQRHRTLPFHRIEMWNGTHFVPVSLKSLGLRIQLNHKATPCSSPIPCHMSMHVIHTNGLHEVAFDYCGCELAVPNHIQLLRRRIYPASQHVIQTCATFSLLELLHKFALTTKAGTYDFYRGLEKLTDCTGITVPKSKYRPLLRMVVQFRHLKMLQWGGRAHDTSGPEGTQPGAIALQCPHCPYPGINLPMDWEKAPRDKRYLYSFFGSMDANFRLKNQLVSNYSQDPGLGIGMAYMLARTGYEGYVLKRAKDGDINTCVGFQAIAQANTRFSKGLRYTGVGAVFCGRSEMVLPLGVGNLQKGERYANMDYIFGSAMKGLSGLKRAVISYDIACQWFTNLYKRVEEHWPEDLKIPKKSRLNLIPAIPKLHEPTHEGVNHHQYSLNTICGVGLCDMECCERFWAGHNGIGNTTKTQGPGSRQDVLDDHFNWWNYLKIINMGSTLLRKYRGAIADRNIQVESHVALSATIGSQIVAKWEKLCRTWEKDPYPKTVDNPYTCNAAEISSEAEVRNQLAKEEEERLKKGGVAIHSTSADAFLAMAHDIEIAQRKIRRYVKCKTTPTIRQETGLTEQRNQLRSRIRTWELLLPIYMPGLLQYQIDLGRDSNVTDEAEHPENMVLWLPSRVPADARSLVCMKGLPEMEERLRTSQCYDALETIRNMLKIKSRLAIWRHKNVRGQREGTRSRAVIDRAHERVRIGVEKYRQARKWKMALSGPGEWELVLQEMKDEDIRGYEEPKKTKSKGQRGVTEDGVTEDGVTEETSNSDTLDSGKRVASGETRRVLSWIWLMPRKEAENDENDGILRVEWVKSRAREMRAKEEVLLLQEEMRRTLLYLSWKRKWWMSQIGIRSGVESALGEGLIAIANKQASHLFALAQKFQNMWQAPLGSFTVSDLWPVESMDNSEDPEGMGMDEEDEYELEEVLIPDGDTEGVGGGKTTDVDVED